MFQPINIGSNDDDDGDVQHYAISSSNNNNNQSIAQQRQISGRNNEYDSSNQFSLDQALGTSSIPIPPGIARAESDEHWGATAATTTTATGTVTTTTSSVASNTSSNNIVVANRVSVNRAPDKKPDKIRSAPILAPNNYQYDDNNAVIEVEREPSLKPGAFHHVTPRRRSQERILDQSTTNVTTTTITTATTNRNNNNNNNNNNNYIPTNAENNNNREPRPPPKYIGYDDNNPPPSNTDGANNSIFSTKKCKLFLAFITVVVCALIGVVVWLVVDRQKQRAAKALPPPPPPTLAPTALRLPIPSTIPLPEPSSVPTITTTATTPLAGQPTVASTTMQPTVDVGGSLTLADIISRGTLRCGVFQDQPGFSSITTGVEGFEPDLCRAIAAALFGTSENDNVEFVPMTASGRFEALASRQVDVLASLASHTMERDVYESQAQAGFTFSTPYLYSGLAFGGRPPFGDCADRLDTSGNCTGIRICVEDGTTFVDRVVELLPNASISSLPSLDSVYSVFKDGFCNVIAGDLFEVAESVVRSRGFIQEYELGSNVFSREPNALVTRDGDPRWSDFVNWVLQSLLAAEEQNITQNFANAFTTTTLFGDSFSSLFRNAIATVGNYAELYEKHLQSILPRTQVNNINRGTSGLILSLPFGDISNLGPGPTPGGTLANIRNRGLLRCGITRSPGFGELDVQTGEWSGLDVDYCRAVSAAIFNGVSNTVDFRVLPATERFQTLTSGDVDLLSRITTWTFARDVGLGLVFSQPNFYDGVAFGGIPPFGRCADNRDILSAECQDLRICVSDGTTTIQRVRELYAERFVVPQATEELATLGLNSGECNALAGSVLEIAPASVIDFGYTGSYEVGLNRFSKEPLAVVTREDDPQFTAFVNWIVSATFFAEEESIEQATAISMPEVAVFGPLYRRMLVDAIQNVGNYREIYERNVENILPRSGLNAANRNPLGAQHYPLPGI